MKEDMALILGVSQEVIEKVFKKKTSGVIETPKGKVKIAKLKPGETPIPLQPKVRPKICLWDDKNEKQEFSSFSAAAKTMKIDSKTIPNALKAGKNSFCRKSDGRKFTIELIEETSPPPTKVEKPSPPPKKVEKPLPKKVEEKSSKKEEPSPPTELEKKEDTTEAEDSQEEFDESEYTYLGMGLWEKKDAEPKPEPEENPFNELILSREFPFFWKDGYKLVFNAQKSNLLFQGEKVEKFVSPENLSRVILVDDRFKILEDFGALHTFEDDFYLSTFYSPSYEEYCKQYANLGILPLFGNRRVIWRIKISQE